MTAGNNVRNFVKKLFTKKPKTTPETAETAEEAPAEATEATEETPVDTEE